MIINCIILDDEQHCLETLSHHVKRTPALKLALATSDAMAALHLINTASIQLLFLDVQMPDVSGIEVARMIGDKCRIILTTAYEKYALHGYELDIADFLLKPISLARFLKAVNKVQDMLQQPTAKEQEFIYIKTGSRNNVMQIDLDTIDYIEGTGNYIHIYHEGKKTGVYQSLKELEIRLPQSRFVRISRSCIIPYSKIAKAEGNHVLLKGSQTAIMLGGAYKALFWEKIKSRTI